MEDNIADVLQELSGLLRRISEQRNASLKPQMDKIDTNALKDIDFVPRAKQKSPPVREQVIQTLEHQSHLLESLIARLHEKTRKG